MLGVLKNQIKIQSENGIACLILSAAGWLAGGIMFQILYRFIGTEEDFVFIPLGTIFGGAVAVLLTSVLLFTTFSLYFNVEVGMGCTRKHFFATFLIVTLGELLLSAAFVILECVAESWIGNLLYPGRLKVYPNVLLPYLLEWAVPTVIILTAGIFLGSTLVMRYGRRASVPLWILWMVLCVAGPNIHSVMEKAPDSVLGKIGRGIAAFTSAVPGGAWAVLAVVFCAASLIISYILIQKQQVTT